MMIIDVVIQIKKVIACNAWIIKLFFMIKIHFFQVKMKFAVKILILPNINLKKKEQKNIIKNVKVLIPIAINVYLKKFVQMPNKLRSENRK